ncbi:hypothetical protein B0J13DRAFT_620630 [Dactylonectria estremocensis]|uniref:Uncharacterized protein n=1 Tax=Dactylonectria estremocensis TaxID=1079267 RepID=A0A9P9F200_9HYPO|nr:hypothetical protein B0J13DRAFT_620630 [Dactylonectria estremocensis]
MYLDQEQSGLDALPSSAGGWDITRLLPRKSEESCRHTETYNTCEKSQVSGGTVMIAIIIVSVILVIVFFAFLLYLHRRRTRMDQQEDLKNFQELDDYGIAASSSSSKASRMPQAPAPAQMKQPTNAPREGPPPSYRESADSLSPSIRGATAAVPRDGLSNR